MNDDDQARELLATSYSLSADRIRDAINGGLTIRNSRNAYAPPSIGGEVVGLCGQGGRHPYFRIPVDVLESALDRIANASQNNDSTKSSIEQMMEEIAAACQDLRQQTYFDTGTGCVNDHLPSMVPLLPPEEIWLDGREVPMDVWKLISFEFDLVSSSVSSQLSVQDFAFSSVTQSALLFRSLISQLGTRHVTFELQLANLPTVWGSVVATPFTVNVSLARLFFEAGSLLTPLAVDELTKWYAGIRYMHWIDSSSFELRVSDNFRLPSIDSRYRGLFAEEMAIGLMAVVLSDIFGAKPINNTVEVLDPGTLKAGKPIADFISLAADPSTSLPTTIIAESKGSLGKPVSATRQKRAKQQVRATNVYFRNARQTLPLTFASTIEFLSGKNATRCIVADPPADFEPGSLSVDPTQAWRVAYAKTLKFVGLEKASQQVLRGEPAQSLRPMDFDRESNRRRNDRDDQRLRRTQIARQRFGQDLLLDVGPCAVSMDQNILAVLRQGIKDHSQLDEVSRRRLEYRQKLAEDTDSRPSFVSSLGLGCVYYSDLDEEKERERKPEM